MVLELRRQLNPHPVNQSVSQAVRLAAHLQFFNRLEKLQKVLRTALQVVVRLPEDG